MISRKPMPCYAVWGKETPAASGSLQGLPNPQSVLFTRTTGICIAAMVNSDTACRGGMTPTSLCVSTWTVKSGYYVHHRDMMRNQRYTRLTQRLLTAVGRLEAY